MFIQDAMGFGSSMTTVLHIYSVRMIRNSYGTGWRRWWRRRSIGIGLVSDADFPDSQDECDWLKLLSSPRPAPVISSCNIRTIPIREAQKMFPPPRPPSPQSRARVQKARMTANPDLLTDKDAAVLMSLQTLQQQNTPSTPPFSPVANHSSADTQLRPRRSVYRPSPEKLNKEFSG